MRTVLPIALVATLIACHNGPGPGTSSWKRGTYGFRIILSGREPVTGAFTIVTDTVTAETGGQDCGPDLAHTSPPTVFHYFSCFPPSGFDKFGVMVDAAHPFSSTWSMMQSVSKTRTVCVRYVVNQRGQTVCAETRNETYFADVQSGGRLILIAVDTTGRH